jgi:hypothetical protein
MPEINGVNVSRLETIEAFLSGSRLKIALVVA